MKRCPTCKQTKPISEYYKDSYRYDGIMWLCKDCQRLRYRKKRQNNPKIYREKDKRYYIKHKEEITAKRKNDYQRDKIKIAARYKARNALYKGIIVRGACEVCGDKKSFAHHDDYTKPLDVRWLCSTHHMRLHHGK